MNKYTIYTDGGCRGNGKESNIGAYAFVIINSNNDVVYEEAIAFQDTTNNQMELYAVIKALQHIHEDSIITVYSDSKYVCDAINNGWISNWCKNGWKTAKKEPVKNQDLWNQLIVQTNKHHVAMKWVKGHNGNQFNERCDSLLNEAMDDFTPSNIVTLNRASNDRPTNPIIPVDTFNNVKDILDNSSNHVAGFKTNADVEKDAAILKKLIEMRDGLNVLIDMMSTSF